MAIQVIREVNADVVKRSTTRTVYAKQNDYNSRFLNVRIKEDGQDITVVASDMIILNVERPDKAVNMFYGEVNSDGTVKVPMTAWMLELTGTLVCDISIVSEDPTVAKLTTMSFNIYVEAAVCSDDVLDDTTEYSIIVDLLNRTEAAEKQASEAAESATYVKEQCEQATQDARDAAAAAYQAREEIEHSDFLSTIRETNKFKAVHIWLGTQEEYDILETKDSHTLYYITNETTLADILSGLTKVGYAAKADQSNEANHSKVWVVSSLSGLEQMIRDNPSRSIGVNIISAKEETGIIIPTTTGNVYIPDNADGVLTVGVGSASLHLTTFTGAVFHLFYNGERDTWVKGTIDSDGWTYEGEWNGLGGKTLGWNDYHGMYAIKLVDIGATNKYTYSFVITPDSADQYGNTRSNCVCYNGEGPSGLLWLRISLTDVLNMYLMSWALQEDFSSTSTYKVYWKKIF